jgi:hypothetical protein
MQIGYNNYFADELSNAIAAAANLDIPLNNDPVFDSSIFSKDSTDTHMGRTPEIAPTSPTLLTLLTRPRGNVHMLPQGITSPSKIGPIMLFLLAQKSRKSTSTVAAEAAQVLSRQLA